MARDRLYRTGFVMALLTAATIVLGYRLVYWQLLERETVLEQVAKVRAEPAAAQPRGTLRDRNGYLLATDEVSYKFGVSPNVISYPDRTAGQVAELLDADGSALRTLFYRDDPYVVVSEQVPYTVGQSLVALDEPAFVIEPILTRSYPNDALAAHLLGFVNAERRGLAGVELYYETLLTDEGGAPTASGPPAEEIKLGHRPFTPTRNGVDLILTIDRNVQFIVERELQAAIEQHQALGGTIVVMEPHTGDLLAMASSPRYDPNHFGDYLEQPEIFQDPAISKQFEPGSIFKIITVAAAIEAGVVTPESLFQDVGVYEVGGRVINNWDGAAYGQRTVTEILGLSLNTGTAWVSTSLGAERFYAALEAFGFGRPTGVDLGSEASGAVKSPGDGLWHPSDLGTNSFGQGIATTPLQMVSAVASLVNGGVLMQPRVVSAVVNRGHIESLPTVERGRSVSVETAQQMQQMLVESVEMETQLALVDGWRIGGKTGTAQVPIPGGYHATDTIATFIGFAPADDPAFVILVKLDRPLGISQWGSQSAAPTFSRVTQQLLNYFNIAPDAYRVAQQTAP